MIFFLLKKVLLRSFWEGFSLSRVPQKWSGLVTTHDHIFFMTLNWLLRWFCKSLRGCIYILKSVNFDFIGVENVANLFALFRHDFAIISILEHKLVNCHKFEHSINRLQQVFVFDEHLITHVNQIVCNFLDFFLVIQFSLSVLSVRIYKQTTPSLTTFVNIPSFSFFRRNEEFVTFNWFNGQMKWF